MATVKNHHNTKNSKRIKRLKNVIKSGTYLINSEVIAKALLQQLDAGCETIH